MNILITGVAGFIGSNLADSLLNMKKIEGLPKLHNLKIIGIDNLSYGVFEQVPKEVDFHRLDVRDRDIYPLFKGVDYVFHLAAKNCISDCQSDPVETSEINCSGTVNVLEASKRGGVKKVIYAESSALYEGSKVFPTPEDQTWPESFYAVSKLASSVFADAYKRYFHMNLTGLRYFNVYGPRQDYRRTIPPVMSAFIVSLLKGERPKIYGTGEKRRDFIHVDDVNQFHLLCMLSRATDGRTFNVGSGASLSVNEIYSLISGLLRVDICPEYLPDLQGEAFQTLADTREATALGWRPCVDIREGILGMIEYIKAEMRSGNIL